MPGLALALAAVIGVPLGLLGSGGSIVTLPVLVYVAGIPAHQAVGMSLAIVGGTSAFGSLLNLRRGTLDLRAAAFFSLRGILGARIGARFTHLVSARSLMMLFGALMLVVGLRMLMGNGEVLSGRKCRPLRCLGTGLGVGLLTGFLGVGGGFVIMPALVFFAGLEMKAAVGTSLAVIAFNSFGGFLSHLRYVQIEWGGDACVSCGGGRRNAGRACPGRAHFLGHVASWLCLERYRAGRVSPDYELPHLTRSRWDRRNLLWAPGGPSAKDEHSVIRASGRQLSAWGLLLMEGVIGAPVQQNKLNN